MAAIAVSGASQPVLGTRPALIGPATRVNRCTRHAGPPISRLRLLPSLLHPSPSAPSSTSPPPPKVHPLPARTTAIVDRERSHPRHPESPRIWGSPRGSPFRRLGLRNQALQQLVVRSSAPNLHCPSLSAIKAATLGAPRLQIDSPRSAHALSQLRGEFPPATFSIYISCHSHLPPPLCIHPRAALLRFDARFPSESGEYAFPF